jgi:hypothetical protein
VGGGVPTDIPPPFIAALLYISPEGNSIWVINPGKGVRSSAKVT